MTDFDTAAARARLNKAITPIELDALCRAALDRIDELEQEIAKRDSGQWVKDVSTPDHKRVVAIAAACVRASHIDRIAELEALVVKWEADSVEWMRKTRALERQRDKALAKHVMEQDTYMSAEGDPELVTYCGYCGWEPASGQPHLDVVLLTPETEASDE